MLCCYDDQGRGGGACCAMYCHDHMCVFVMYAIKWMPAECPHWNGLSSSENMV